MRVIGVVRHRHVLEARIDDADVKVVGRQGLRVVHQLDRTRADKLELALRHGQLRDVRVPLRDG